jgi:hypothetical protein
LEYNVRKQDPKYFKAVLPAGRPHACIDFGDWARG